jgi:hypothetical protein
MTPKKKAAPAKKSGAPKGNKNALKHGAFAKPIKPEPRTMRSIEELILRLEDVNDRIFDRLKTAGDTDEFTKLTNTFSTNTVAIFNGHRTLSFVSGSATPVQEAYNELKTLEFDED